MEKTKQWKWPCPLSPQGGRVQARTVTTYDMSQVQNQFSASRVQAVPSLLLDPISIWVPKPESLQLPWAALVTPPL